MPTKHTPSPYKPLIKNFIIFLIIFLIIAGLFSNYTVSQRQPEEIGIQTLIENIRNKRVASIIIENNKLLIELKDGGKNALRKETNESFGELAKNYGLTPEELVGINIKVKELSGWQFWLQTLLPFFIPFLLIGGFIYLMMRQVSGANTRAMMFGQSGAREIPKNSKDKISFKDVAGVREAKNELQEVVEFLKDPKKFTVLGAKIPKGVLLMGSPGTGKTLLARAVAGEADVPFFHISGSEFVEMFVGVGASRVRDLFRKAKKSAPAILFIDEIDAVGRQRGAGLGGSHDEREQTLNQILVEMDGFDPHTGVIVIAATNRPDVLDPALLRPGRFDRRIILDDPDIRDREEILKVHAKGKPLAKNVSLKKVAQRTPGFTGADLANVLNEAAILAARRNKKEVGENEALESIEKVLLGPERRSHLLSKREKEITAYHEAGHALVAHELPDADPVHKVSIISRGQAGGYTLKLPIEDRRLHSLSEFRADLAVMMGGHTAERLVYDELTTGASNDLKQATDLARRMVMDFGMSETLAPRVFGEREEMVFLGKQIHEQRNYSEKTAELIDKEIDRLIRGAQKTAENVITKKRGQLDKIATTLIEKETLEKEAFETLLKEK